MDIRITRTGKIFYRVDPTLAAILLEALPGSFEQIEKAAGATVTPKTWSYFVGSLGVTGKVALHRRKGATTEVLTITDGCLAAKEWPECPAAVIAQFDAIPLREKAGWTAGK